MALTTAPAVPCAPIDAHRDVQSFGDDFALVADFEIERIQIHDGLDGSQRTAAPLLHPSTDTLTDGRDEFGRDRHVIFRLEKALDVART